MRFRIYLLPFLRIQSVQKRITAANRAPGMEVDVYRVWQELPILVIVSMLAYFCFLEQLLVANMGTGAIALSLPFFLCTGFPFIYDIFNYGGTDMSSPHGIPVDLLDRLVIIRTETYDPADMIKILAIRAQVEELVIDEESLAYLGEIGQHASLRHAVQLLSPASVVAKMNGRDGICKADQEEASNLYLDAKSSARLLQEQQDRYIS